MIDRSHDNWRKVVEIATRGDLPLLAEALIELLASEEQQANGEPEDEIVVSDFVLWPAQHHYRNDLLRENLQKALSQIESKGEKGETTVAEFLANPEELNYYEPGLAQCLADLLGRLDIGASQYLIACLSKSQETGTSDSEESTISWLLSVLHLGISPRVLYHELAYMEKKTRNDPRNGATPENMGNWGDTRYGVTRLWIDVRARALEIGDNPRGFAELAWLYEFLYRFARESHPGDQKAFSVELSYYQKHAMFWLPWEADARMFEFRFKEREKAAAFALEGLEKISDNEPLAKLLHDLLILTERVSLLSPLGSFTSLEKSFAQLWQEIRSLPGSVFTQRLLTMLNLERIKLYIYWSRTLATFDDGERAIEKAQLALSIARELSATHLMAGENRHVADNQLYGRVSQALLDCRYHLDRLMISQEASTAPVSDEPAAGVTDAVSASTDATTIANPTPVAV